VARDHLHRQHLLDRLDQRLYRPLTLVSAPAGYGKSTLMSCWLEASEVPSAWLSLDEDDNDLYLFLSYFIQAVQTIFPDAVHETQAMLNAPELPPVTVLSHSLINELDQIEKEFILVLDDYHFIREKAVHDLIAKLLKHPPAPMHLALVTRRDPALPLTSLRSQGQMTEIRTQDLRFSLKDSRAFLEKIMDISLDNVTVAVLEKKTEGWVTGLRLIALTLRNQTLGNQSDVDRLLENLPEDSRYVVDYILSEVLSQQSPAMQENLLKTAILDRFCAPLCDAVCKSDEASNRCELSGKEFIEKLVQTNLFVIPLDAQHHWVRYHHMFQRFLLHLMQRRYPPDEISALHKKAGAWFEENGLIEEALVHLLKSGDNESAALLVENHRHDVMNEERWPRLDRWLNLIPADLIRESPELFITKAWVLQRKGLAAEAWTTLDQIDEVLSTQEQPPCIASIYRGEVEALRCYQHYVFTRQADAESSAQDALDRLPHHYRSSRGFAALIKALSIQMGGDLNRARKVVNSALQDETASYANLRALLLFGLCMIDWIAADLSRLKMSANRYLKHGQKHDLVETILVGNYFSGILRYERNELEAAENYLLSVVQNNYIPNVRAFVQTNFVLALTFLAQGRSDKAIEAVETVASYVFDLDATPMIEVVKAFQAEFAIRQGRIAVAERWARHYNPAPFFPSYEYFVPQLTFAKVLLARNMKADRKKAGDLLSRMHDYYSSIHCTRTVIDIMILQALLYDAREKENEALSTLEKAATLAEPGGFIRPFLDLSPKMADLLNRLANRKTDTKYISELITAFRNERTTGEPPRVVRTSPNHKIRRASNDVMKNLTNRELEIIALLVQRLSNKEIAEKLFISPETVKRHIYNIYRKLKVSTRREAEKKVNALGIREG